MGAQDLDVSRDTATVPWRLLPWAVGPLPGRLCPPVLAVTMSALILPVHPVASHGAGLETRTLRHFLWVHDCLGAPCLATCTGSNVLINPDLGQFSFIFMFSTLPALGGQAGGWAGLARMTGTEGALLGE